jgi:ABC-type nitrate/sulfonate/bicarbonate transport system substrate-binding protein
VPAAPLERHMAMDVLNVPGYHRRPAHLAAEYKGFFAAERLQVIFHEATFAPDHNRGMAEGRWDFTLSSADTMIARTTRDGVDYKLFMQAEEGLSAYLIGRGVRTIEDLRGRLLAGDPGDSNLDLIRKKILHSHGLGENDHDVEIIGSSPRRLEAFLAGRVAAAMLTPPSSDVAMERGGVLLASADDYVPRWPLTCGWALASWLEERRELAVRFIRAWAAATDWLLEPQNREECLALIMDREKLKRPAAERAYDKVVPRARINPDAIRRVIDLRIEMGVYPPPHDPPARFYDESFWREATQ